MEERSTNFNMHDYKYELDRTGADVMPDYWEGHARMRLYEIAADLSDEELDFAMRLLSRIHDNAPTAHERLAESAKRVTLDKLRG